MSNPADIWIYSAMSPAQEEAIKWLEKRAADYESAMARLDPELAPYNTLKVEHDAILEAIKEIKSSGLRLDTD